MSIRLLRILFSCLVVLAACGTSVAQISPGELSRFHESLEGLGNCTRCHELGQEVAAPKCLECHQPLAARINAGTGYHSSTDVRGKGCRECHSEHNGRDFELIHWTGGKPSLNHSLTGYELEGAHRAAECRECHKPAFLADPAVAAGKNTNRLRTFLGLETRCLACHHDEHGDQLRDDCQSCHGFDAWTPAPRFSHDAARYPLTGRHRELACDKCHAYETAPEPEKGKLGKTDRTGTTARYSGLDYSNCSSCHRDPHETRFGPDCQGCHTTENFGRIIGNRFDHSKTVFPLAGKHAAVTCARCHKSGTMTEPVAHARCTDCHRDAHGGQFSDRADKGACESCHTVQGFKPSTFDRARHEQSRYPLTGSHLAVPCVACHAVPAGKPEAPARFDYADSRCQSCHADPHQGQLNQWIEKNGCEFCHTTESWHHTSFDHKLSRFALEGKHRETACLSCHRIQRDDATQKTLWMKPLAMECQSCHKDPHRGQFLREGQTAVDCARCHSPQGWKEPRFEHNRDSRFALEGAHAKVACAKCHKPQPAADGTLVVVYRPLETDCVHCHGTRR